MIWYLDCTNLLGGQNCVFFMGEGLHFLKFRQDEIQFFSFLYSPLMNCFMWLLYICFRTSHPGWRPWKNHLYHWHRCHWSHGYSFRCHKHHSRTPHIRKWSNTHRLPHVAYTHRHWTDDSKQEWKWGEIWRNWVFMSQLTVETLFYLNEKKKHEYRLNVVYCSSKYSTLLSSSDQPAVSVPPQENKTGP